MKCLRLILCIFVVWTFREFLILSKSMGIDLMVPPSQWHLGTKKRGLIKELSTTNCPFLSGLNKALFPGAWGGWAPWMANKVLAFMAVTSTLCLKALGGIRVFLTRKNHLDHRISRWVLEIPQKLVENQGDQLQWHHSSSNYTFSGWFVSKQSITNINHHLLTEPTLSLVVPPR